jgi:GT2 family glycosyltransferase
MLKVSILIIAWNSGAHLAHCLDSLCAQTYRDFEVIIVDNGSTDGSVLDIERKYVELNIRTEHLASNLGFAFANNIGARLANTQWLALLNADAYPEPDWLKYLVEAAISHPNAFFASRQIKVDQPELLDGEGDKYHVSGLAWRRNYNLPFHEKQNLEEVFSSCAAAALYPRQAFLDVGGFDEDYFSYFEDVDLGFRLRLSGAQCFFVPQAVVFHVGSASTGKKSNFSVYYGYRNLIWTFLKDMPDSLYWLYLPLHLGTILFFALYLTMQGQGRAIWRAIFDAIRSLPQMLHKRRQIQQNIKIKPLDLFPVISSDLFEPYREFINRNGRSTSK